MSTAYQTVSALLGVTTGGQHCLMFVTSYNNPNIHYEHHKVEFASRILCGCVNADSHICCLFVTSRVCVCVEIGRQQTASRLHAIKKHLGGSHDAI